MQTHKLANGPLVISVASAEVVEGNFGTQIMLTGIDCMSGEDVRVYVNETTAARQLERLGLSVETVADNALHIEQIKKDGRTYTNFRKATQTEVLGQQEPPRVSEPAASQTATSSSAAPAPAPRRQQEDSLPVYVESLKNAIEAAEHLSQAGYAVTSDNVVAIAATLFIQRSRR